MGESIGWGVIGAGGIADRRTMPAMAECEHVRLAALMDIDPQRTRALSGKYGVAGFDSAEALLQYPDVQAVYIATPVDVHCRQTIAAARSGKHVLVEKPLARNLDEADRMIAALAEAGVFATEGYMMRFHSLHRRLFELVGSGALGQVVSMRGQLSCWYPPIEGAWRQQKQRGGGGALMDMATHIYDLMMALVGPVRSVRALVSTQVHGYEVDDSSTTLLEFASGTHATVDCFFGIPDRASFGRLEVYGSRGSVLAEGTIGQDGTGTMTAYLSQQANYEAEQPGDPGERNALGITAEPVNMYAAEVDYLSRCILEGEAPTLNTIASGREVLEVALAAYRSAAEGRRIPIRP